MLRRKYHPHDVAGFVKHLRGIGSDHVVLGSAVVAESKEPLQEHWEWPTGDDMFFFSILYSIGYPSLT